MCYRRIVKLYSSMEYQAYRVLLTIVVCMLPAIHQIEFNLRMTYVVSIKTYSGSSIRKSMRYFQWNNATIIGWIIVRYFIQCHLGNNYHRACIWCTISDIISTWLAPLFIDDSDVTTITNKS